MRLGLDYSAGRPSGAAIRAAGYDLVIRYLDDPRRAGRKHLTPGELADLTGCGVEVLGVFEGGVDDVAGGFTAGVANARRALAGAGWCGYTGPILMAVDEHLPAVRLPEAMAYLDGAVSVLGRDRTGAYGFQEVIDAAIGRVGLLWQCGHRPAPGGPVHLWQRNTGTADVGGVTCDVNEVLRPLTPAAAPAAAPPADLSPRRASEDPVALIAFPPTPAPTDPPGGRWQDADPSTWPVSPECSTALVPAVPGGWRGLGSISSIVCGWAGGQDGPDANGRVKPSGFIDYLRVFSFADQGYTQWQVNELVTNTPLTGNRSLPAIPLPSWCTFLVVRYSAPAGLHLGIEYQF